MFILWAAFEIHGKYEDLEKEEVDGLFLDGSDFTVDVKNIPEHSDIRVFKAQLCRHIEDILKNNEEYVQDDPDDPNAHKVADLNFALTKYSIMKYFKIRMDYEKQERVILLKESLLDKSSAKSVQAIRAKLEQQKAKLLKKQEANEAIIKQIRSRKDIRAVKVYVTMQSMEGKKRVVSAFRASKFRRCCSMAKYKSRYINNRWLSVADAPKASIINWENLSISKTNRCWRILAVSMFSGLLILVTFVVMLLTKSYQRELTDTYNASTCPTKSITLEEAYHDYTLSTKQRTGTMHCYCLSQYNSIGLSVRDIEFPDGNNY